MAQNDNPVRIRHYDYAALARELMGEDWNKPETAYTFSNDRKFDDDPHGGSYE